MSELISVMIPVYNAEKHIGKCLDSLINQTYENIQIVVVNDGSKDSSRQICEEYAKKDKRIKLVNQENGGEGAARNTGLREADGDYLCFVDADDYVREDFIDNLFNIHSTYGAELAICGFTELKGKEVLNETSGSIEQMSREQAMENLLKETSFKGYVWNKLFCMNIIRENNITFDVSLAVWTDVLFVFTYMLHIKKAVFDPTPKYYYIYVESSVSHQKNHVLGVEKSYSAIRAKNQMVDKIPDSYTGVKRQIYVRYIKSALAVIRNIGYLNESTDTEYYRESINIIKKYKKEAYGFLSKKDRILVKVCCICPGLLIMAYRKRK